MSGADAAHYATPSPSLLTTALCTVGRTGNDLHYRGYDILEIAEACEFEEIAYLLIHGKLPTLAELVAYKRKLRGLRELPPALCAVLELLPATTHPMDVMRTAVSVLGCLLPESPAQDLAGERDITDRLVACLGSATTIRSGRTSCICCTAARPPATGCGQCIPP